MRLGFLAVASLIGVASAKNYVILYPETFNSCNIAQTTVTGILMSSVLLNSDSFTTAGSDVLTMINDAKTMESINIYYPKPLNTTPSFLGESCSDIINFVESTNQMVTSIISSNQGPLLKDSLKELLDENVILLDGSKLPEPMDVLANRYYWQGTIGPSIIILPECVNPPVSFDPASARVDFYGLLHKYLPALLKEGHERIRNCDGCIKNFMVNLLTAIGYEGEDELLNAGIGMLTYADEHAEEIANEIMSVPESEFPKTLGELVEFTFARMSSAEMGNFEVFQNNSQMLITAIDELYAEVAGYGESAILDTIRNLVSSLGCRTNAGSSLMQRAYQ